MTRRMGAVPALHRALPARPSSIRISVLGKILVRTLCGLGLSICACTQQIELFPDQAPPDALYADAAPAEGGHGCVPALDPAGLLIPCVCKAPCRNDADCRALPDASAVRCDVATGLCAGHDAACRTRADCTAPRDPSTGGSVGWLCISAK